MTDAVPQGHLSRAPGLEPADRATLEGWIRARLTPQRTVLRSRIVLLLADGLSAREVARRLGISRHTVDLWRVRYAERGCDVLTRDNAGRGRKRRAN
jgi:DNA invertase Pin-like site-specific DNA recombinase